MMQLMVVRQGSKIQKLRELGRFTLGLMEEHGGSRMGRRKLGVSRHETEGVWRFQAGTEESHLLHVVQEAEFGGSRQRRTSHSVTLLELGTRRLQAWREEAQRLYVATERSRLFRLGLEVRTERLGVP